MPLAPGSRIGPYEMVAPLGAGGMGEVYRARDAKLNRDVALKVLPDAFALDPGSAGAVPARSAGARLTQSSAYRGDLRASKTAARSMRSCSSLSRGRRWRTGSKGEGRGQRACRLKRALAHRDADRRGARSGARAGRHPPRSEAGEHQAAAGRDREGPRLRIGQGPGARLKPSASDARSPTITTPAMMTGVGVILGTAAYMSPEQAKGRPAGKRSDVWAFGCVLYEMLTGKRAFDGEDVGETLAAVIKSEPDWNALPRDVPPAVRTLIERCLEKNPRKRVADSSTASFVLREPSIAKPPVAGASPSALTRSSQSFVRRAWPIAAAALIAGAVVGAALRWKTAPVARPAVVRFQLAPAEGEGTMWGPVPHDGRLPRRIPVGLHDRQGTLCAGDLECHVAAGRGHATRVSTEPAFSPDGRSIAFVSLSDRQLKVVPVAGGICDCPVPDRVARDGELDDRFDRVRPADGRHASVAERRRRRTAGQCQARRACARAAAAGRRTDAGVHVPVCRRPTATAVVRLSRSR